MRIFVLSACEPDDALVSLTLAALHGHDVTHLDLEATDFRRAMSIEERRAYHHPPQNLLTPETQLAAENVRSAEALVFVAPMSATTVPSRMKGFLDRVLIDGVAFEFNEQGAFRPRLKHIRRVGLVTRSPHSRRELLRYRDGAYRTILRTIRLNCGFTTRASHVCVAPGEDATDAIKRAFRNW